MNLYLKENLKVLRERKQLNQIELSKLLGMKTTTYNNYETGFTKQPSFEDLKKIARFYGITLDDLIFSDFNNVHLNKKTPEKNFKENVHLNVNPHVHLIAENYENKETDEIEEAQYLSEADTPVITGVNKDPLNAVLLAFKAIEAAFTNMYSQQQQEIAALRARIEEATPKPPE